MYINIKEFVLQKVDTWRKCTFCGKTIYKDELFLSKYIASDMYNKPRCCNMHIHHFSQEILDEIMVEML